MFDSEPGLTRQRSRASWSAMFCGAVAALAGAVVTGFLLLINGSFVLVFLHAVAETGPEWFRRKGVLQFALFVLPPLIVVVQWMIWDLVRGLFGRRVTDKEPWNST